MTRTHGLVLTIVLLFSMIFSTYGMAENLSSADDPVMVQPALNTPYQQGPDYELVLVELPVSESQIFPGGLLHPSLIIKNAGSAGLEGGLVNISGYLGNISLIPVSGSIPALKEGEKQMVTLTFQIPDTFDFGGYVFSLMVDPDVQTSDTNVSNNGGKAGGIISITPPDDNEFIGCEACWEGYR